MILKVSRRAFDGARRAISHSCKQRTLNGHRLVRFPLARGAKRHGCARGPEYLRRHVVVRSVDTPDALVAAADFVALSRNQSARHDAFKDVRARSGEFEVEVIERAAIGVIRLPGEAIRDGKLRHRFVAPGPHGGAFYTMLRHSPSEVPLRKEG